MSKAFLRESDFEIPPDIPQRTTLLPAGVKNYLTEEGARRLQRELDDLLEVQRPPLSAAANDPESRRELQIVDRRIRHLQNSLRSAEVVSANAPSDRVRFGSVVSVRESDGNSATYRIVGVDEADLEPDWISWRSPLAQALLDARPGQKIIFTAPSGERELQVLEVR
jgi:transcription elongation factor GreB